MKRGKRKSKISENTLTDKELIHEYLYSTNLELDGSIETVRVMKNNIGIESYVMRTGLTEDKKEFFISRMHSGVEFYFVMSLFGNEYSVSKEWLLQNEKYIRNMSVDANGELFVVHDKGFNFYQDVQDKTCDKQDTLIVGSNNYVRTPTEPITRIKGVILISKKAEVVNCRLQRSTQINTEVAIEIPKKMCRFEGLRDVAFEEVARGCPCLVELTDLHKLYEQLNRKGNDIFGFTENSDLLSNWFLVLPYTMIDEDNSEVIRFGRKHYESIETILPLKGKELNGEPVRVQIFDNINNDIRKRKRLE